MCYSEGSLQALLDGEVSAFEKRRMEEHLSVCPACRETVRRLAEASNVTGRALRAYLQAGSVGGPDEATRAAWERLDARVRQETGHEAMAQGMVCWSTWWMEVFQMIKKRRFAMASVAAVLTVAVLLSFGSVRAAAGRFLSVFRVSRFETVTLSPDDVARIEQVLREGVGSVDMGDLGRFEIETYGPSGLVSLEQAKAAVDFVLRLPSVMPTGFELQGLSARRGGTVSLTLDVGKANQILKGVGVAKMLPNDLNGETFTLRVPVVIDAQYGSLAVGTGAIHVLQARSPELDVPGDAAATAVRDAVLSLPFLPESLKRQVASVDDWQHTFLVPDIQGSTQVVNVDGADGVFMTAPEQYRVEAGGARNAVVWLRNGVVYAIIGTFTMEQGLAMANSMR